MNRATLNESYRFGDISYAKEELRAELASVFLAAERGIPHDPEQHAAYVGSWIKTLKEDKHEIFRAAHDASRAADFLLALDRDRSIAAKCSPKPTCSIRPRSEARAIRFWNARRGITIGKTGRRALHHLPDPREGHLTERRWNAQEPRGEADSAMHPETIRQSLTALEPHDRPSPIDFKVAYQARVVLDRIRFVIKHIEQFAQSSEQVREVSLQLLDALDRLDELDRHFQIRSRMGVHSRGANDGKRSIKEVVKWSDVAGEWVGNRATRKSPVLPVRGADSGRNSNGEPFPISET